MSLDYPNIETCTQSYQPVKTPIFCLLCIVTPNTQKRTDRIFNRASFAKNISIVLCYAKAVPFPFDFCDLRG